MKWSDLPYVVTDGDERVVARVRSQLAATAAAYGMSLSSKGAAFDVWHQGSANQREHITRMQIEQVPA